MAKGWLQVFTRIHEVPVARKIYIALFGMFLYTLFIHWSTRERFVQHPALDESGGIAVSLLIGVLLVLRTNSAYDRWWEGRKLWGQLVNDTRNLALKFNAFVNPEPIEARQLRDCLAGFAIALKEHLRSGLKLNSLRGFENRVEDPEHVPAFISQDLYLLLKSWRQKERIDGFEMMQLDTHMKALMDICGACERIRSTPIALSYRAVLRQGIGLYLIFHPWLVTPELGLWAVPVNLITTYFLVGLELIAECIEEPFGKGDDNLPLDQICENIAKSLDEILGSTTSDTAFESALDSDAAATIRTEEE
ncbi:MAG: bestrophin family ion channel [Cyanobacteriota/Melainabacteria group bacterium]